MPKQAIRPKLPSRFITPLAVLRCRGGVMSGSRDMKGVSAKRRAKYIAPDTSAAIPNVGTWGSPSTQRNTARKPRKTYGLRRPKRVALRSLK